MAFLDAVLLNDKQMTEATNDKRFFPLGIVNLANKSTADANYISPAARDALAKMNNDIAVQIPVIKDQTCVVTTSPGFNIPANLPEADKYSFQFYDVFSGMRHYPAAYAGSMIEEQFAMQTVMKNVLYDMGREIESILASVLNTRKSQKVDFTTQVSHDGTISFNAGTDTLEIDKASQQATMFYALQDLMEANDLGGEWQIVVNPAGLTIQRAKALQYGAGNDKNLQALSFLPLDRIHESKELSAGSDIFNGYFVRMGGIGMFPNFPYDFANGTEIAGRKWSISDMPLPFTGMRANIYTNKEATSANALIAPGTNTDLTMTHFSEMAIWHRFCVAYEYNSDLTTRSNSIVKIKGLTT